MTEKVRQDQAYRDDLHFTLEVIQALRNGEAELKAAFPFLFKWVSGYGRSNGLKWEWLVQYAIAKAEKPLYQNNDHVFFVSYGYMGTDITDKARKAVPGDPKTWRKMMLDLAAMGLIRIIPTPIQGYKAGRNSEAQNNSKRYFEKNRMRGHRQPINHFVMRPLNLDVMKQADEIISRGSLRGSYTLMIDRFGWKDACKIAGKVIHKTLKAQKADAIIEFVILEAIKKRGYILTDEIKAALRKQMPESTKAQRSMDYGRLQPILDANGLIRQMIGKAKQEALGITSGKSLVMVIMKNKDIKINERRRKQNEQHRYH